MNFFIFYSVIRGSSLDVIMQDYIVLTFHNLYIGKRSIEKFNDDSNKCLDEGIIIIYLISDAIIVRSIYVLNGNSIRSSKYMH